MCSVFDYCKAFDTVPHRPLLEKLISFDLNSYLIQWIADYLTDRFQRVAVEGELSNATRVLSWVLQGSVPGPLLF